MEYLKWNDNWKYWETSNAFSGMGAVPEKKKVTLPHDAMLETPAKEGSKNGFTTGHRDGAVYHYSKKFLVPEEWRQQTNYLKFEGVYMNASVFINGEFAGKCHYGYNTFYIDLDRFLYYGKENEVHVIVNNSGMRNSRWYSGGGIYRDVYLVSGGLTHICKDSLQIRTKDVQSGKDAVIAVKMDVAARNTGTKYLVVDVKVKDTENKTVAAERLPFLLFEGRPKEIGTELLISNVTLWSDKMPYLYSIEVKLCEKIGEKEDTLDIVREQFGIRTVTMDAKRGLLVNGASVKLRGACIHQDAGILGVASYEDAAVRQMKKLKEAGFNAIRMSHHPMGQAMLRACDRVGMYVMDETFDMWNASKNDFDYSMFFDEDWKFTIRSMVEKDFNHPCVILYSLGNEIPESGSDHGIELCHEMAAYTKQLDPTRYVTEAINGVFAAGQSNMDGILQDVMNDLNARNGAEEINDFMTVMQDHLGEIMCHPYISKRLELAATGLDLLGYNYMASRYEKDREQYPNRVIVGSETYPPAICREWDVIERCPNVIGEFTWTGWDYLGETGIGISKYAPVKPMEEAQYPNQLAYCGDIDITGFRRPMSYLRQIVYEKRKTPYIAVQNPNHYGEAQVKTPWMLSDASRCWNWETCEKKPVVVEVYSAAEEVELWINGRSAGKKAAGKNAGYRVLFDTVYESGKIEAAAYENGVEVGRDVLYSASEKRHLQIEQEERYGNELAFYNIFMLDENGILAADASDEIQIEVIGGELLGCGSANYAPDYEYRGNRTKLFEGRAQAVVRKKNPKEKTELKVNWKK